MDGIETEAFCGSMTDRSCRDGPPTYYSILSLQSSTYRFIILLLHLFPPSSSPLFTLNLNPPLLNCKSSIDFASSCFVLLVRLFALPAIECKPLAFFIHLAYLPLQVQNYHVLPL
jgi:hypothetical protein